MTSTSTSTSPHPTSRTGTPTESTPGPRPFGEATLRIERWADPVVDPLGHHARSLYVETFWLPVLGPSTVWLLRHLARRIEEGEGEGSPHPVEIDLAETARCLGLGERSGRHGPFIRTLSRCIDFEMAELRGARRLAVRTTLPPLARRHLARLPDSLRLEHERLELARGTASGTGVATSDVALPRQPGRPGSGPGSAAAAAAAAAYRPTGTNGGTGAPSVDQLRTRARQLALSLVDLGEDAATTERQLLRWRFHPALARECTEWAAHHRASRPAS